MDSSDLGQSAAQMHSMLFDRAADDGDGRKSAPSSLWPSTKSRRMAQALYSGGGELVLQDPLAFAVAGAADALGGPRNDSGGSGGSGGAAAKPRRMAYAYYSENGTAVRTDSALGGQDAGLGHASTGPQHADHSTLHTSEWDLGRAADVKPSPGVWGPQGSSGSAGFARGNPASLSAPLPHRLHTSHTMQLAPQSMDELFSGTLVLGDGGTGISETRSEENLADRDRDEAAAAASLPLDLPPPVTVQVASRKRRVVNEAGMGRGSEDGRVTRGAVGVFYPQLYLTGGDCIESGGQLMSRGRFERLAGTATAKWHVSIKVLPSGMTIGRWLQQHGLPVLQGRPRKRRGASDNGDMRDDDDEEAADEDGGLVSRRPSTVDERRPLRVSSDAAASLVDASPGLRRVGSTAGGAGAGGSSQGRRSSHSRRPSNPSAASSGLPSAADPAGTGGARGGGEGQSGPGFARQSVGSHLGSTGHPGGRASVSGPEDMFGDFIDSSAGLLDALFQAGGSTASNPHAHTPPGPGLGAGSSRGAMNAGASPLSDDGGGTGGGGGGGGGFLLGLAGRHRSATAAAGPAGQPLLGSLHSAVGASAPVVRAAQRLPSGVSVMAPLQLGPMQGSHAGDARANADLGPTYASTASACGTLRTTSLSVGSGSNSSEVRLLASAFSSMQAGGHGEALGSSQAALAAQAWGPSPYSGGWTVDAGGQGLSRVSSEAAYQLPYRLSGMGAGAAGGAGSYSPAVQRGNDRSVDVDVDMEALAAAVQTTAILGGGGDSWASGAGANDSSARNTLAPSRSGESLTGIQDLDAALQYMRLPQRALEGLAQTLRMGPGSFAGGAAGPAGPEAVAAMRRLAGQFGRGSAPALQGSGQMQGLDPVQHQHQHHQMQQRQLMHALAQQQQQQQQVQMQQQQAQLQPQGQSQGLQSGGSATAPLPPGVSNWNQRAEAFMQGRFKPGN
ncbi:hypothetical protein HYH03_011039 [Edaphochlamys debaryana]|uniref:Uncharacterized protein n=1 Tax=Edaphochlamys debaryana TaxID=47281 RepID=A0A835XVN6_9CHLO|nr:hypothetical protein HYH03_011039 [Edaphochlamys debaryana]|eukprot:KAG2490649.1 hypothetical protein HYH03_011039 [Edaphochlamys debaryana]